MTTPSIFDVKTASLTRPTLLEASAGTGKTYSIKHLVLRFVVEADIPVSRLLVMTFTRAATAELKVRVESHLSDALALLTGEGRQDIDPILEDQRRHWNANGIDDDTAVERIRASLADFDNAGIFTIHGFCQKVIEDNAFSSGGSINFELADESDDLIEDAVRDYLRREVDGLSDQGDVRALVQSSIGDWVKRLKALALYPEALVDRVWETGGAPVSAELDQALERFMREVPEKLRELKRTSRVKTFDDLLRELYDRLSPKADPAANEQAERLAARIRGVWRGVLVDEFQDTDPVQYAIIEKLFITPFEPASEPETRTGRAVYFVGDPKQAIYSFRSADLNTYFRARMKIISIGGTVAMLGTNFRSSANLVDAFNSFWERPAGTAFLRTGLDYQKVAPAPGKTGLWVKEGDDWKEASPLEIWTSYRTNAYAAGAAREANNRALASRIVELIEAGRNGEAVVAAGEGDKVTDTISINGDLVPMRSLEARDIAVLVRTRDLADEMRDLLARVGVRVRYESQDDVCTSEEAAEMILILRAFASPSDMRVLRAARTTRLIGDVLGDMDDGARDDARQIELREIFEEGARRWAAGGPAPAIRRLMVFCDTSRRLLPVHGGERTLVNYAHLSELLHTKARVIPTPIGLATWLEEAGRHPQGSSEERRIRLESDANLVTLQTIHSSKGLQYPVVFIPAAQTFSPNNRKEPVWRTADSAGHLTLHLSLAPDNPGPAVAREAMEELVRLAYVGMTRAAKAAVIIVQQRPKSPKNPAEWYATNTRNAWYAALTASHEPEEQGVRAAFPTLRNTEILELEDLDAVYALPMPRLTPEKAAQTADVQSARNIRSTWMTSSFTGISNMAEDDSGGFSAWYGEAAKDGSGADILNFPKGAQAGSCLHEMFEEADFALMARDDDDARKATRELCSAKVKKYLSISDADRKNDAVDGAAQMIRDVLNAEIAPGLFLRDLPRAARSAELEFLIPVPKHLTAERLGRELKALGYDVGELRPESLKGFLTGFIDLAFTFRGRFYVLDWKSNKISTEAAGYDPEAMDKEMARHMYRLQYLIYLVALRRFLRARIGAAFRDDMLGGAVYVFLRGVRAGVTTPANPQGIVLDPVDPVVIRRLDDLFAGAIK
ncbi:UvrD-helicase domain-containing protein [Sutterella sp.]|uniref:UvrD-helicase domain-containing protein n=1 Tax=Sutterella sp. TaxID=1981025 RepID=UPI0026E1061D|nr:UvrD-helicase domain-containing protein [Sutterella sp.]MDO5531611.1 UvrD-helicase domain-containing protein [Sutterella sp.]